MPKIRDTLVVAVCGGRDYRNRKHVWQVLNLLRAQAHHIVIAEGGCRERKGHWCGGADRWAKEWAMNQPRECVTLLTYKPDWDRYGKSAGPRRAIEMLEEVEPDLLLAFPGGKGTRNTIQFAHERGIKVEEPKEGTLL